METKATLCPVLGAVPKLVTKITKMCTSGDMPRIACATHPLLVPLTAGVTRREWGLGDARFAPGFLPV